MAAPDWLCSLPDSWGFGISRGGRIFFINEEAKSTTWLHPLTGETLLTGHRKTPDLPTGWEEGYTFEGARYYIKFIMWHVSCKSSQRGAPRSHTWDETSLGKEWPAEICASETGFLSSAPRI
ncbi:pleckstrin homology domain-containing family A member 5 isoform X19 [Xenopus laevis]|uniref:Pleckstrin homology domain-containing family A member 5 isoform X19 n=1 Tax=Xenopus laevis TaxID=8355 RepID=A0A8J1MJL4_XENLA|nr:pleckstrin homology domain-containing family A member 5 isoform X19 [Xenopus laevis]